MTKSLSNRYIISIPVKPYVKQYLEFNYGNPIDLTINKPTYNFFVFLCMPENNNYDEIYDLNPNKYSSKLDIVVSDHHFYHYGWQLSNRNIFFFGRHFESLIKLTMRVYIGTHTSLGFPLNKSITKFKNLFSFTEEIWSYESIKKDFYRNGNPHIIDFETDIYNKVQQTILQNLNNMGYLTNIPTLFYEKIK